MPDGVQVMAVELPHPVAFGVALIGGLVLADKHHSGAGDGGHQAFLPAVLKRDASDNAVLVVELEQVGVTQPGVGAESARIAVPAALRGGDSLAIKRCRLKAASLVGEDQLPRRGR